MTGPNRIPLDPRVPRWDATGEAVELPEPEPESEDSGAVIAWMAVALIVTAIVIGWLVTR